MDDYTIALAAEAKRLAEQAKEIGDPIGEMQFLQLAKNLLENSEPMDPEFCKAVDKHFWDLI